MRQPCRLERKAGVVGASTEPVPRHREMLSQTCIQGAVRTPSPPTKSYRFPRLLNISIARTRVVKWPPKVKRDWVSWRKRREPKYGAYARKTASPTRPRHWPRAVANSTAANPPVPEPKPAKWVQDCYEETYTGAPVDGSAVT